MDLQKREISKGSKTYEYLDLYIELSDVFNVDASPVRIKDGMPFSLSVKTKLGKTVMRFGVTEQQIASRERIDLEKVLMGKIVTLQTIEEETDAGTFARVVEGSLKPQNDSSAQTPIGEAHASPTPKKKPTAQEYAKSLLEEAIVKQTDSETFM